MTIQDLQPYLVPFIIGGFFSWRILKDRLVRKRLPALLEKGAIIIDVRSPAEFAAGSSQGSVNIPLDELNVKADQLDHSKSVILCCASGTRSALGAAILKRKGFQEVINAGSWRNTVSNKLL